MTAWRFIDGGCSDGAYNMALDEALLTLCADGKSPPTLRIYGFRPRCLSIGKFQSTEARELAAFIGDGTPIIRRPSGGLAVLHDGDVAYCITAPYADDSVAVSPREAYSQISLGLAEAMCLLGARDVSIGVMSVPATGGLCFASTGPYDIYVGGRKVIGSAQARKRGAYLQHGSIRVGNSIDRDGINSLLGRSLTYEEVRDAFRKGIAKKLNVEPTPGSISVEESSLAQQLLERYARDDWTFSH